MGDNDNVIKLPVKGHAKAPVQPQAAQAFSMSDAGPINPKSILDMTEVEQELFLRSLRDRRLKAAEAIANARAAKRQIANVQNNVRMEKKIEAVQKQHDRVATALAKLEEMVLSMRALQLHLTPTSRVQDDNKGT